MDIGAPLGVLSAIITFIASWIYCIAHYGFLLGVGLGWLPSAIVAVFVGFVVAYLWGLVAVAVVLGLIGLVAFPGEKAPADDYAVEYDPSAAAVVAAADAAAAAATAADPYAGWSVVSGGYEDRHGDAACTEDCSGHEAGYAWAEEQDISDAGDCGGTSQSFVEGCEAYVEDNGG